MNRKEQIKNFARDHVAELVIIAGAAVVFTLIIIKKMNEPDIGPTDAQIMQSDLEIFAALKEMYKNQLV